MHFESVTDLLIHADRYLDSLVGSPPKDAREARERIDHLLVLRDEMERFHFPNPRFAVMELMRILHEQLPRMEKEDVVEILPQIRLLKYAYDVRKWTYERARAAYIANRAALRIYELGILKDYIPYFPYGGEYRLMLEEIGGVAYLVLRKILEDLGVREERLEIEIGEKISARRVPAKKGIFRDRLSTVVLVSTVIRRAWEESRPHILSSVRKIKDIDRIEEYERIVRKYDPVSVQRNPKRLWDLLQELEEKGFLVDGEIDPRILEGLREKRLVKYRELKKRAWDFLEGFFFEYYMFTPVRERRNRPIMPGIPADHRQVPVIAEERRDLIALKESVERDLGIPAKYAGAAVLCVKTDKHPGDLAKKYNLDAGRLERYARMVRDYISSGSRVRKFFRALGEEE